MVDIVEGYMPEQDIQEIEKNVLNNSHFPWFWEGRTTSDNYPAMMHVMVGRYDEPPLTEFKINSPWFHLFERIFLDFCHKNNIQVNQILRAAVNLTWYSEDKYGDPHVDHPGEHGHKVCMMYLHDLDYGPTFIFNEKGMGWAIDKENDEMITDVEIMELRKGEVVKGKDGRPVRTPDQYEEVTEANARIEGDVFNDPYYSDGIKVDEIIKEVDDKVPSIKYASGGLAYMLGE